LNNGIISNSDEIDEKIEVNLGVKIKERNNRVINDNKNRQKSSKK